MCNHVQPLSQLRPTGVYTNAQFELPVRKVTYFEGEDRGQEV